MLTDTLPSDDLRQAVIAAGLSGSWLDARSVAHFSGSKGAYLLLLQLQNGVEVCLPSRPSVRMKAGGYIYCGSARGGGGIAARLKRHFRRDKKLHWHIDRLTGQAAAVEALAVPGGDECDLAARLLRSGRFEVAAEGFGSSDCRTCRSHLLMPA